MVNAPEFDVPPPGAGVNTVTDAVPCVAMSEAEIAAWSWVALPNVVGRSAPFQRTLDELMNFVPVSASVKAASPATTLLGEIELSVGAGLLIVNVCALEVPPPGVGLKTVADAVPAVAMSLAEIAACSCVLLTKVVARSLPFHRTTDEAMKFVPVAVRVNPAPPATALLGEIELSVGTSLLIVNVCALEVPPPGVGLKTVTGAVPADAMSPARICA